MTPAELRALMARLGHTQATLAKLLRVSRRTVRRYANGQRRIPDKVRAVLLAVPDDAKGGATR